LYRVAVAQILRVIFTPSLGLSPWSQSRIADHSIGLKHRS
jgi:hypothetical protein